MGVRGEYDSKLAAAQPRRQQTVIEIYLQLASAEHCHYRFPCFSDFRYSIDAPGTA